MFCDSSKGERDFNVTSITLHKLTARDLHTYCGGCMGVLCAVLVSSVRLLLCLARAVVGCLVLIRRGREGGG